MPVVAPYGTWSSPVTPEMAAAGKVSLRQVETDGADLYWVESRPLEGGRDVLVGPGGDRTGDRYSVRSSVHEYGGGAAAVHHGEAFFVDYGDQRLYRLEGETATPITSEPPTPRAVRYADLQPTPDGAWVVCVRETHAGPAATDVENEIVAVPAEGTGLTVVLAAGRDFYAAPRISPDGRSLAWLTWDLPGMPWDGTELWTAELSGTSVSDARCVAGGGVESVAQPEWSPRGDLHWVSDATAGWWNLHAGGRVLYRADAEFAEPQWVFGQHAYTFLDDGRVVCSWRAGGRAFLGVIETAGAVRQLDLDFTSYSFLRPAGPTTIAAVAASPTQAAAVVLIDIDDATVDVVRRSQELHLDGDHLSVAEPITFATGRGQIAHGLHYPPRHPGFAAPAGERPPLIVMSHGGPTAETHDTLDLSVQFWTTRGFAVVHVNYRGSTGYGRAYRNALDGQWGVADVEDCTGAAAHLVAEGRADPHRVVIRGGSAGGYTTLCALTFTDDFAAGASYYGIGDLEALARDTHKFESRYLDRLVAPYPAQRDVYVARSPIHHTDRLSAPMILFQGSEDRVVPPAQSEAMAAALRAKGLPFEYLLFEGEGHGFRRADSLVRALGAELAFYGSVLGFQPAA